MLRRRSSRKRSARSSKEGSVGGKARRAPSRPSGDTAAASVAARRSPTPPGVGGGRAVDLAVDAAACRRADRTAPDLSLPWRRLPCFVRGSVRRCAVTGWPPSSFWCLRPADRCVLGRCAPSWRSANPPPTRAPVFRDVLEHHRLKLEALSRIVLRATGGNPNSAELRRLFYLEALRSRSPRMTHRPGS